MISNITLLVGILNMFMMVFVFFLVYILSIFLHEMGHLFVLRKHSARASLNYIKENGRWKLYAGKEEDYLHLSDKDLKQVYAAGVMAGFFPYIIFAGTVSMWILFLVPLYIGGCRSDLKKLKTLGDLD